MARIGIDRLTINLLYQKHKDYIVPIAIIVVCFLLLIKITIPQIGSLSVKQQEVKFEKEKLSTLKNNLKILSNLNESALDSQLSIVSDALPEGKNFAGVLNSISISANKAGVFLGDFDFQVGDLSKVATPSQGLPNLQLSLVTNGNVAATARFINELYKSLPISEITSIEINSNRAVLNTFFYYKPFLKTSIDESFPLSSLSKTDLETIAEISSWNNSRILEQIQPLLKPTPVSSSSAF